MNNLFISAKVEQELSAYRDKMNNVRFHCNGESVAAMVCACDVTQPSFDEGPWDHPALFSPKNLRQLTMKRCMKAEYFGRGGNLFLSREEMHIKGS